MSSPSAVDLLGVALGAARAVAVGRSGTVLTSTDDVTWSVDTSISTTDDLHGVWIDASGLTVVVGGKGTVLTQQPGGPWTPASVDGDPPLVSVWGAAPDDVYALAKAGEDTLVYHFAGTTWEKGEPLVGAPRAIVGSGPTHVWVVTDASVYQKQDSGWSAVNATGFSIQGAWATGEQLLTVGPPGRIARFAVGSGWNELLVGTGDTFTSVWVSPTSNDVVAVGPGTTARYDGSAWQIVSSFEALRAVDGRSPTDVLAVGAGGLTARLNGANWFHALQATRQELLAVWSRSASDSYAVGAAGAVAHHNGTRWKRLPGAPTTTVPLRGIWGFDSGEVIVVGGADAVYRRDAAGNWHPEKISGAASLSAVWGSAPQNVFVTDLAGQVFRSGASGWPAMGLPTDASLRGIWGTSATDVHAVGDGGAALRYDGSVWLSSNPATVDLLAVGGSGPTDVWAVGAAAAIHRFDGSQWADAPPCDPLSAASLYAVSGAPGGGVSYAAGDGGQILRLDATSCTVESSGTLAPFRGLFHSSDRLLVVGAGGAILSHEP